MPVSVSVPEDLSWRQRGRRQQRQLLLKEKEALSTGTEVREVINLLLHERQSNPQVLLHYANALETLTIETSNHQPMLQKTYVQQLVGIANEASGPTQAAALRAAVADLVHERLAEVVAERTDVRVGVADGPFAADGVAAAPVVPGPAAAAAESGRRRSLAALRRPRCA